jgi:hypothetical protein
LKNVGHRVARSTIAGTLTAEGIPPRGGHPTAWRTFLKAHWPALVAADFFTAEVWTTRGLVTFYTVFVIELESRRVRVVGSTRNPDEAFVVQALRQLSDGVDDVLRPGRVLICDRDPKWSETVAGFLEREGVRIVRTQAHAELQCARGALLYDPSRRSVLTACCSWVNATCVAPLRRLWRTIMRSGIIKVLGTS